MLESIQNADDMAAANGADMEPAMRDRSRSPHQVIQFDLAQDQVHQS